MGSTVRTDLFPPLVTGRSIAATSAKAAIICAYVLFVWSGSSHFSGYCLDVRPSVGDALLRRELNYPRSVSRITRMYADISNMTHLNMEDCLNEAQDIAIDAAVSIY